MPHKLRVSVLLPYAKTALTSMRYAWLAEPLQGGLNNMLLHTAILLEKTCAAGDVLVLPRFNSGYQMYRRSYAAHRLKAPLRFGELFDVAFWQERSQPCRSVEAAPVDAELRNLKGDLEVIDDDTELRHRHAVLALYGALRPAAGLRRVLAKLFATATKRAGPRWRAVHLRIERDWWFRAAMCHRAGPRRCYSPDEVSHAIQQTRHATGALLLYASDNISPCGPVANASAFGARALKLKLHASLALSYTARSAVEFFLAAAAPAAFYGNSFSSFSRGVAAIRAASCASPDDGATALLSNKTALLSCRQGARLASYAYDCGPMRDTYSMLSLQPAVECARQQSARGNSFVSCTQLLAAHQPKLSSGRAWTDPRSASRPGPHGG